MGTFQQILEEEGGPRPAKKSRLAVSVSWREFMPPNPDNNSLLEIFGEMGLQGGNFGIGTPSPSPCPVSISTPLISSPDLTQCDSEEVQEAGESGSEKIEVCGRRRCLRCNSDVGLRVSNAGFPPPISSIGRNGKPWVQYQTIKTEGRFVLKEIRVPGQQCMHATRENGHLLLQLDNPDSSDG